MITRRDCISTIDTIDYSYSLLLTISRCYYYSELMVALVEGIDANCSSRALCEGPRPVLPPYLYLPQSSVAVFRF